MKLSSADERRSARSRVMLTATVEGAGGQYEVRIDDLSAHGARVVAVELPAVDEPVVFHCKGLAVEGFVAWIQPPLAGIGFDEPIETQTALRKVSPARPPAQRDFRRPGLRGKQLSKAERQMIEQWGNRRRPQLGE